MPREVTSCWPQSTKECRALTSEDALRSGTGHSVLAVGGREPRAPKKTPTKGEGAREDEAELGINSLASLLRTGLNWQILFLSRQSSPILDASRACLLSRLSHVCLCRPSDSHQAPLSMGFSRQEYWSGLPCPPPGVLPYLGIKPRSPALAGGFFTTHATWEAQVSVIDQETSSPTRERF